MNIAYERTKMRPRLPSSIRHPKGSNGGNLRTFMVLAAILSFCLLAPLTLLAGPADAQALEASAIAGQHEGTALLAGSDTSRGVILLAQADETPQSYQHDGSEGSGMPTHTEKPTAGPRYISNVSDLMGCWASSKSGTKIWDGVPHYFQYCFDNSGKAKTFTISFDQNGNEPIQCVAYAEAKMDGKGFEVKDEIPVCPGWSPVVLYCELSSPGTVNCTVKGDGGKSPIIMYYNADIEP